MLAEGDKGNALPTMLRLAFTLCWMTVGVWGWLEYDKPVWFQCPSSQFLSRIKSKHDNGKEDRIWDFRCFPVPNPVRSLVHCRWTGYVNDYDQPVTFQCPNEGVITGMASKHSNHHEDRIFRFRCCDLFGAVAHGCYFTGYQNAWDDLLDYNVPRGRILKGMVSYHDNGKEDRRFKFEVCRVGQLRTT